MGSTVAVFASPPGHRSQEQPWGDGAVQGWMEAVGRGCGAVAGWGMVSLSQVGVLEPKALGQGRGYSLRTAQVAWG